MSQAFFKGVATNLPNSAVTFDKFHVVSLVNQAVEQVRRSEQVKKFLDGCAIRRGSNSWVGLNPRA